MFASNDGHKDVVLLLIERGAKVSRSRMTTVVLFASGKRIVISLSLVIVC